MSLDTYIVEGGIGKCVCFSALIPKLAEKAKQPIQILTPYIDVFANNPLVKIVFDQQSIPLDDPRILASDNIYYSEPYKSNFVKGDEHLIQSYSRLHGVPFDINMRPKMYTNHVKLATEQWKKSKNIGSQYIMVQFSGGQTPINWNISNPYSSSNPGRNYHPYFAQAIINALKQKYPSHIIIDATLPNEQAYQNTVKCDQTFTVLHELLKGASGFIGIDSCLQHFAASTGTPGVVIWGNTRWTQFGWMHHKNVTFHEKNKFNTWFKADVSDPRNIMVDPNSILDIYINHVHDKKLKDEQIQVAHRK